jgi:hypothetical protein
VLDDDNPDYVDAMLRWMYRDNYDARSYIVEGTDDGVIAFHVKVMNMADKYDLPGLARNARGQIHDFLSVNWWETNDIRVEVNSILKLSERDTAAYKYAEAAMMSSCCRDKGAKLAGTVSDSELKWVLRKYPRFTYLLACEMLGMLSE